MTDVPHETCGTCKFRYVNPKNIKGGGACHESPPVPIALPARGGIEIRSIHPPVNADHAACGKWAAKDAAVN